MANIIARGIDVSEWQGAIDWEKVKASGKADFAMLRLGFGWDRDNQVDKQFTNNIAGCRRVGIPFGAYHYSYAKTPDEAVLEAKWAAKVLGDTRLDYPVAFDLEDGSQASLSRQTLTDICKAFCRTMEGMGYYVSIYTNLSWIKNKLYADQLTGYDKWIAQWNNTNTYDGAYGLWQYTNSGSVQGIKGKVDLNYAYKDYPALMKARSGNPADPPKPDPPKPDPKPDIESELRTQIAQLQAAYTAKTTELVAQQEKYKDLQAKYSALKATHAECDKTISMLKAEMQTRLAVAQQKMEMAAAKAEEVVRLLKN